MRSRVWFGAAVALAGIAVFATVANGAVTLKTARTEVALDGGDAGAVPAACKRRFRAVSGGFADPTRTEAGPGTYTLPFGSERTGRREWSSFLLADGDDGEALSFAYCSDDLPRLKAVEETVAIDPNTNETATASCPRGGEAVSGGFRITDPADETIWIWESYREGKRKWVTSGWNNVGDVHELTAVAYCAKARLGLRKGAKSTTAGASEPIAATAKCKRNSRAVSGGFAGFWSDDHTTFTEMAESRRAGKRGWTVSASSFTNDVDNPLTTFVYCLKKNALD